MSLDFDVNCSCDCPGDAPNGGMRMIKFRNVQPADLLHFRAAAKAGQITGITCPDCGCEHRLDDDGGRVVTVATVRPQIRGIGPNTGPLSGGNDVGIYGHAFDAPGLVIKFGGVPVTNIRFPAESTGDSVTVTAPTGASRGPVDVTVEGTHGLYPVKGVLVGGYTYVG